MTMPTPTVPFPEAAVWEWTCIDTRTAPGLYAYRHIQASNFVDLPAVGGGDLDAEQCRESLRRFGSLHKPLAALALFLGVVALEDFVRDLAARLADTPECLKHFPHLADLRAKPRSRQPSEMFKRLDTDPAGVLDPEEINLRFKQSMAIEPIPVQEYWHLRDLALLRHTVAHHAAVIRKVDVPRFAYFIVVPGRLINPPPEFVRSELRYLYDMGRTIERSVQSAAFKKFIAAAGAGWSKQPPQSVIELIELFGYFGYIETTDVTVGRSEQGSELRRVHEAEAQRIRALLLQRCVADLKVAYGE